MPQLDANGNNGVKWEETTGVLKLKEMFTEAKLLIPAIMNDCVRKSKFENVYGCRHTLNDGIMRTIVVMFGGMLALVCGNGDVGKGLRFRSPWFLSSRVLAGCNPLDALQAYVEGFQMAAIQRHDHGKLPFDVTSFKEYVVLTGCQSFDLRTAHVSGFSAGARPF